MDCIFCKILKKEIPSRIVYEDDICMGIMDAFPTNEGHVLIITKEHIVSFDQASDEVVAHLAKVTKMLSQVIKQAIKPDGVTILENSGLLQEINHCHIHLIPTYENQRGISFDITGNVDRIEIEYQKLLSYMP